MFNIGIDLGTSRTKIASDNGNFSFASVYARQLNKDGTITEMVGEESFKKTIFGAKAIWPIVKGSVQGSEQAVKFMIKEAIRQATKNPTMDKFSDVNVAIGLPYHTANTDAVILEKILKEIGVNGLDIHYQVTGTLKSEDRDTAIIVSIGHGTTEILVYYEEQLLEDKSQSLLEGGESILGILGHNKFLDPNYVEGHKEMLQPIIEEYASQLSNILHRVRKGIRDEDADKEIPIIISGGGIDIPGMKESLNEKMIEKFSIVSDNLFSNAIGLHILASNQDSMPTTQEQIIQQT